MFDDVNLASIQFNDINEWLQDLGIKTGIETKKEDLENTMLKKINTSPDEHVLTNDDYWQGCPTILNSEVAALKVARRIYDECEAQD